MGNKLDQKIVLLKKNLEASILKAGNSAIGFSGGLDSTIILALSDFKLKPFTVGFPGSHDLERSRYVSDELGFRLREIILDRQDLEYSIPALRALDPNITHSEMGYELVLYHLLERCPEDTVVTGQGADEIFYGYRRFMEDPGLTNASHLDKLFHFTLPREIKIANQKSKRLVTPYLDPELVRIFSGLPRDLNVSGGTNKIMLRTLAKEIELPEDVWSFRKKAAQYGSGIQPYIRKILGSY
ncbi:MAG: asparagine synthase-related protein [Thermoplasmataceae archaeon]